ncbi:MAG: group II intron maturase-specific domain-containing protein [Pseudomonadota bacterium]
MNGTKTEQSRAKKTHVLRVEPTKDKIKAHWREISDTIWKLKSATAEALIGAIQPKITGWANYYKTVHSSEASFWETRYAAMEKAISVGAT